MRERVLDYTQYLRSDTPERAMKHVCNNRLDYLVDDSRQLVQNAFAFANRKLKDQPQINFEPAVFHSIALVEILGELQMEANTLAAAMLINTVHGGDNTPAADINELESAFGEDIAALITGVGRIGQIRFSNTIESEAENFRRMLMAMSEDIRVMIIHLANRLQNMRCLDRHPQAERRPVAGRTLEIYAPIAERLGLYSWARELQDICLRVRFPNRHRTLNLAMKKREGNRKLIVERITESMNSTLLNAGLKNFDVVGRRKTVYSVYRKMVRKNKNFNELYDTHGFRVIVDKIDTCYRALGMIHAEYKPVHGRFHDYIAIPKANGYQSLHTVVAGPHGERLEVQIRTRDMHRTAEAGVAAHWVYKQADTSEDKTNHMARQWLMEILDPEQQSGSPIEFLEHLKADLYPDEVYVFTPKGDIRKLPRGATALDFAFAVHSDIGIRCAGVRVNNQLASLPTVLQNGDRVEIMTSSDASPTSLWLNYAITARARVRIRNFLKQQSSEQALELGKRLLAAATKQRLFGRRKINSKVQQKLLSELQLDDWSDLLIEIGQGTRLADIVARQIAQLTDVDRVEKHVLNPESLVIRGSEGLIITYSKCCSPIPGDTIMGTLTAGHGLAIHQIDCPNTIELRKHPERCL
ncbi:MAG: RelA/SpoT family protein, partial [Pseudomonadota bacterium]